MKIKLLLSITALLFFGCEGKSETAATKKTVNISRVKQLYNSAAKLKLPLQWVNTSNRLPVDKSKLIHLKESDTAIFGDEAPLLTLVGVLPDTSNFYTFLFYYPADDLRPEIHTIDKNGNTISSLRTSFNCGADCGYYCVGAEFTFKKDFSFLSQHKSYRAECNKEQTEVDTTSVTYFVIEKKGRILSNGEITEGKETAIEEREMPYSSPENPLKKED